MADHEDPRERLLGRRRLLRLAGSVLLGGAAALSSKAGQAAALVDLLSARYLSFLNVHTSARLAVPYA